MRMRPAVAVLLVALLALPLLAAGQFRRRSRQTPTVAYDSHFVFTRIRYNAAGAGWRAGSSAAAAGSTTIRPPTATSARSSTTSPTCASGWTAATSSTSTIRGIFENPIIYMSEPGYWTTTEAEAKNLRAYLLKGGFIIFDDFEGDGHWHNMVAQMRRALPEHHFIRIDVSSASSTRSSTSGTSRFRTRAATGRRLLRHVREQRSVGPDDRAGQLQQRPRRLLGMVRREGLYGADPTNDAYRLGVNYIVYGDDALSGSHRRTDAVDPHRSRTGTDRTGTTKMHPFASR